MYYQNLAVISHHRSDHSFQSTIPQKGSFVELLAFSSETDRYKQNAYRRSRLTESNPEIECAATGQLVNPSA
jgi:hypothetical protein